MGQAKSFGVECFSLSAEEAKKHFPYITTDGIEGAAFIPGDGYIDPYSLTMAYAKGARSNGAKIEEGVCVEEIVLEGRRAVGVVTNGGTIACDILVNCAGLWAKRVGNMAGVPLAAGIVEHQYFLTEKKLSFDAGPDDAARSRQQFLSEARYRLLCHWRLGGWFQGLPSRAAATGISGANCFQPTWNGLNSSRCQPPRGCRY